MLKSTPAQESTSPAQQDKFDILKDRAHMLHATRSFFFEKDVMEVDCPILCEYPALDAHIDLITTSDGRYLHTSPEYGMKRLLSQGLSDIYQVSHVFREGEAGEKHNPEFTMIEWYRLDFTFEAMILETADLICRFLGQLPLNTLSYREVLQTYANIDYTTLSANELVKILQEKNISIYSTALSEGKDALLNLLLSHLVEPYLGNNELTALIHYPGSQAALAKSTTINGEHVAKRFEIYYQGVELANGYQELTDPKEQRSRFEKANGLRLSLGKKPLPLDEKLLMALEEGLPECCGVAVGFDRLMMLRNQKENIKNVIPFNWEEA